MPFVEYLVCGIWLAIWIVSAVYTFSIGEPEPRENYKFITEVKWDEKTRYIVFYQFFMLFWIDAFIVGVAQFVIAASACIWYFEVNSDTGATGCVGRGIKWAFRYHLGSIAFGAAIIAICEMIRAVFEYYRRKIKSMTSNKCVDCLVCCIDKLLCCLEKCVKYITENAYIQVALTNNNFCRSALNAFCLILKNVARFGWLDSIGFVLNWFGVCSVAGVNGFCAYIVLTKVDDYKLNITQPIAPTIVVVLISFIIAKSFLSIISYSMDAILQSFLLDESIAEDGRTRPDHMQ